MTSIGTALTLSVASGAFPQVPCLNLSDALSSTKAEAHSVIPQKCKQLKKLDINYQILLCRISIIGWFLKSFWCAKQTTIWEVLAYIERTQSMSTEKDRDSGANSITKITWNNGVRCSKCFLHCSLQMFGFIRWRQTPSGAILHFCIYGNIYNINMHRIREQIQFSTGTASKQHWFCLISPCFRTVN